MLQIIMLLFCALSNGNAKSIVTVSFQNDSVNQIVTETRQFSTTENYVKLKSDIHIEVRNEQITTITYTLKNETQEVVAVLNDTVTSKHKNAINITERAHILYKIHARITRSKDAIWATITLTFMFVLLAIAVAQSKMWKDYKGSESQGVPLPNFNERVLFKDVMERRMTSLKEIFKKKKKSVSELESLLPTTEWE